MLPIAIQLYSVRDDMEKDPAGTLKKIKEMGYDGVELAGTYGHSPEDFAAMVKDAGLVAISAHVPYQELSKDPEGVLAGYKTIGCRYVAIPYLEEENRISGAKYEETLENIRAIAAAANKLGITLLYHNHDFEFEVVDGEFALDILYKTIPADLLQTEVDTCWVKVAGQDPAAYVRKYTGRAPIVHLKDFFMSGGKAGKLYDLIGLEDEAEAPVEETHFEFRPVGSGMQDFPAILAAAKDAGAGWVVVEQDMPTPGTTPMECAQTSLRYLRSL